MSGYWPSLRSLLVFAVVVVVLIIVKQRFGIEAVDRLWGVGMLAWAVYFSFKPAIPFWLGRQPKEPLIGWKRGAVLTIAYVVGLSMLAIPHQFACALHMRGSVCP
jgi:hypothetical protein